MDHLVEQMYNDVMIVEDLNNLFYQAALNNGSYIDEAWKSISNRMKKLIMKVGEKNLELAQKLLRLWQDVGENETDFRRLSARAESMLLPIVMESINTLYDKISAVSNCWIVERSVVGFFTLKNRESNRYIHSPYDPMKEAFLLANSIYKSTMEEFHILGAGLGYLAYQLWVLSGKSIKLFIYEDDIEVIKLAFQLGIMDWIYSDSIIIVDAIDKYELIETFLKEIKKGKPFYISDWKETGYKDIEIGEEIERISFNHRTERMMGDLCQINRRHNLHREYSGINELKKYHLKSLDFVIVSSGPSLDDNIIYLKENAYRIVIVAVNSALKRLAAEGIKPDFSVMIDPTEYLKDHINGLEEFTDGIPLVTVSSGCRFFIDRYRGPVYYVDLEENEADDFEWNYGGTVSSLALDVAYYLGAEKIYLIGSDLAFPNRKNFADGLVHEALEGIRNENDDGLMVDAVDGKKVPTCLVYNTYREIIEKQISMHNSIVYNMSMHGASIKGTRWWADEMRHEYRILPENEQAFLERYGDSLKRRLDKYANVIDNELKKLFEPLDETICNSGTIPQTARILLLIGIGDGIYLRSLWKKMSPGGKLLLIEPEEIVFLQACCKLDFSELIKEEDVEILFGNDELEKNLKEIMYKEVDYLSITHLFIAENPKYRGKYNNYIGFVSNMINSIIRARATDYNLIIQHGREMFLNQLYSLLFLPDSNTAGQLFRNIPRRDVPVVLVGAGPSLNKNVSFLKGLIGKAIIIACTRSTSVLDENGIKPDLVAMADMEPGHDYCEHDNERSYRMLFHVQASYDVQKLYQGKGIYFDFNKKMFPISGLEDEMEEIPAGGSVITMVFSLFLNAGFNRFILLGMDLAYDEDGRSHSAGVVTEKMGEEYLLVEGIGGGQVRTRSDWILFRNFFEEQIQKNDNLHVIDASEGGALIHGTEICNLAETVERLKDESANVEDWITAMPRGSGVSREEVRSFFNSLIDGCSQMQLLLSNLITYNNIIRASTGATESGNMGLGEIIEEYNRGYQVLIENEKWDLIRQYCPDIIMNYVDRAQYFVDQKNDIERLKCEEEFLIQMRSAESELRMLVSTLLNNWA